MLASLILFGGGIVIAILVAIYFHIQDKKQKRA